MTAIDEKVSVPESEKVHINSMAEKFAAAMAKVPAAAPKAIAPAPETPPAAPEKPKPAEAPKPAEKPPEKPPEPVVAKEKSPPHEQFEELKKLKDKYKTDYETLKSQFDPIASERDQLKAKLDDAVKGTAEYEQAKQRLSEYEKIVKQIAIEHDPQFQAHFKERISNSILEAEEAAGSEHATKIKTILQLPSSSIRDREIETIVESLTSEVAKMDLMDAYRTLKRTERERRAELDKAPENYKKLQEVQAQRAKEEQAKVLQNRSQLLEHINHQIEPELADTDADTAKAIKDDMKKMVHGEMDAQNYVGFLIYGAKGRKAEAALKTRDEKIAKLEAQITELQSTQPNAPRNGRTAPLAKDGELPDIGKKFREAAATVPGFKR